MHRLFVAPALVLVVACSAAPAAASTTLGELSGSGNQTCAAGAVYWMLNERPDSPSYAAAASGVITSFSVGGTGNAGSRVRLVLLDPGEPGQGNRTVEARTPVATLASSGPETIPARLAIKPAEQIALATVDPIQGCVYSSNGGNQVTVDAAGASAAEGGSITATAPTGFNRLNLSATLEPDADGDGYGDDTQDSCPADPAIHSGLCVPDLALSAGASPASALAGGVAAVAFTVANHGAVAHGVAVKPALPAGLTLAGSFPACQGTCPIGDLASGETTTVTLLVSAAAPGTYAVSGVGSSSGSDNNAADNGATANVTFASALGKFPACTVPPLKGLPRAFAKRLLGAAGCKLGKVTRKKARTGKRGSVIKQGTKAGTVLPFGATVQVTVRR